MVSYETVQYFDAEACEFKEYRNVVKKYQDAERKVLLSLSIMNIRQNMVVMVDLMTCFTTSYQATIGQLRRKTRYADYLHEPVAESTQLLLYFLEDGQVCDDQL